MKTEKTLSTQYFILYRAVAMLSVLGIMVFFVVGQFLRGDLWFALFLAAFYAYYTVKFWMPSFFKFIRNFRKISYDQENLYINQKGSDLIVPFEDVLKVELVSLDGIYKFKLNNQEEYYCKPSIWYPFTFKKVDAELNKIRKYISERKRKVWEEIDHQTPNLPSN